MRKLRGLSQKQLAKAAGISQPSLSDIETGETSADDLKAPTLMGLSKALETNPDYLRSGKATPVQPESLSPEEAELVSIYRDLAGTDLQAGLLSSARGMLAASPAPARPTRSRPFVKSRETT